MNNLKRVQIDDQALKFPGQLSGGQQQRAALLEHYVWNLKLCFLMNQLLH